MGNKVVEFTGTIVRKVWGSDSSDFRIYACDVSDEDIKQKELKRTIYGNVSISGNIHELSEGLDYSIQAEETYGKHGYTYKVIHISRDRPKSADEMYIFLKEVLTENQAKILWQAYPDIVERIIKDDTTDIDLSKTCGIKKARFEVIKRKIIENYALAEMVIEFKGLLTMKLIHKLYQKYESINLLRKKLREEPYVTLCSLPGVGFRTADDILLELEKEKVIYFPYDLVTSKQRCLGAIIHTLQENEHGKGNTRMSLIDLKTEISTLVPKCADKFIEAVQEPMIYYDMESITVALLSTYLKESYIAKTITRAIKYTNNQWNVNYNQYKCIGDIQLTEDQQRVIELICKNPMVILGGFAGSGKSMSMKAIIQLCKDNYKTYLPLSSTGKAAKVLAEYIQEPAQTIHRGLGYGNDGWTKNKENKLTYDLVIIDEFSMVDVDLFTHVIDAIDFNRTKLLIVGDPAQLPSVGAGNLLHDFIESNQIPKILLNKIFRYSDGGLMKAATDVRNGKKYLYNLSTDTELTLFGDNEDYGFIQVPDEKIIPFTLALYKQILSEEFQQSHGLELDVSDVQVLTAKNVGKYGTDIFNRELQKIANKNYGSDIKIVTENATYYIGDMILQTKNNYSAPVYVDECQMFDENGDPEEILIANGETGYITKINKYERSMFIDFNGVTVKYYATDLVNVSLGYAITAHKSQGSQIKIPIIIDPSSHKFMSSSNLLYVMLTRTQKIAYHLGEVSTVNYAVRKHDNMTRNTYMCDLLHHMAA